MEALGFVYLGGFIIAWIVLYHRVGFPDVQSDWREFILGHPTGFGGWALATIAKAWFWPATLAIWLATGSPASRWKAVEEIDGRETRRILRI